MERLAEAHDGYNSTEKKELAGWDGSLRETDAGLLRA